MIMNLDESGLTRLELATSAVTGRCSNQLNYNPRYYYILTKISYLSNFLLFTFLTKEKQGFEPWVQVIVR
jgi:hypothetical protein